MDKDSRIYVAGHRGLVGSALRRRLERKGYSDIIARAHSELDLENPQQVREFFASEKPEYVFLAAAKVGGILANSTYPVDFLLRNLKIQVNIIEAAWRFGVKGLVFLASSCIYPKLAAQPLKEEYLFSGILEPTNEPYAVAKIAGIELCASFNRQYGTRFLSVMPTNCYGLNDNYDLQSSHVLPAFIRKFHLARMAATGKWGAMLRDEAVYGEIPKDFMSNLASISLSNGYAIPDHVTAGLTQVTSNPAIRLWGTGTPKREFLYSEDLADACVLLMEQMEKIFCGASFEANGVISGTNLQESQIGNVSSATRHVINIGCGADITIGELSRVVSGVVGFNGPIEWDTSKPDGTPRKLLDTSRITRMGWVPSVSLDEGIRLTYADYLSKLTNTEPKKTI